MNTSQQDFNKQVFENAILQHDCVFDGWAVPTVVRTLCEMSGIHPVCLARIPFYTPKSGAYGRADDDCPYLILPRGESMKPRYLFTTGMRIKECFVQLTENMADLDSVTGWPIPYQFGFDDNGQFFCEAVA